jgi:hypothetical protein
MKGILHLMTLLAAMASLGACGIAEDWSGCRFEQEPNLTLAFSFEAVAGKQGDLPLTDKIASVDILLFDGEGLFVERRRVERAELELSPDVQFTLWPGHYLVTAWANISSGSRLSPLVVGECRMEEAYVELSGAGDSLYYAPALTNIYTQREVALRADDETDIDERYAVHLPEDGGHVVKELPFIRAYRSVTIYFRGIEHLGMPDAGDGTQQKIIVEAENLDSRYDLFYNSIPGAVRSHTLLSSETLTPEGLMQAVRYYMVYAPITDEIRFTPGNLPAYVPPLTIRLADYLRDHPLMDLDDIEILIQFLAPDALTGVQVSVTAPAWSSTIVKPEY